MSGPDIVVAPMETEHHFSVAFGWSNRRAGKAIAQAVAALALGESVELDDMVARAVQALAEPIDVDAPEMITDAQRRIPAIGITATNGKTTTTRLLAHLSRAAGFTAGWCTTSGVYIDGEKVLDGDYTGPSGARRVLLDPKVEMALLETARGGILLRGLGYESNDVSIFINVSPDHLGLLGIWTVEGLAITKSTVTAVTKPGGAVVLNADDPLVWQFADTRPAPVVAVSRKPESDIVRAHMASGGAALLLEAGEFVWHRGTERIPVIAVEDIPITYGGRAMHMVENSMHATAGALAAGLSIDAIRTGLKTFRSDASSNPGRLNLYTTPGGVKVLIDFAHNEAGVEHLLSLAKSLVESGRALRTVAGSAGDRPDESIQAMIRMSAEASNGGVYLRGTQKYLRGRETNEALSQLYYDALAEAGKEAAGHWPTELEASQHAVNDSGPGDVVAIMAYEQSAALRDWLLASGAVAQA
jgi:cyanophycin synthetase